MKPFEVQLRCSYVGAKEHNPVEFECDTFTETMAMQFFVA